MSDDANIGQSSGGGGAGLSAAGAAPPAGAVAGTGGGGGGGAVAPGGGGGADPGNRLSKSVVNTGDPNIQVVSHIRSTMRNGVEVKSVQASVGRKSVTGMKEISYTNESMIGNGSFGVVYKATLVEENEVVAIKRVLQDRRFKNRELSIMVSLEHCNIVRLKYYFYTYKNQPKDDIYLNLVLEFIPDTVSKVGRHYMRQGQKMPLLYIKLYMYQLFRSLAYIHHLGICHRDIKPQNLLVNPMTGVLKLCDFGSAKHLVLGEMNVSYICSRYYRAPELIFGATNYTTKIDIWSAGCVFAELWLGFPIFSGESGVDQLVEIIKVLGTPTREQILRMNRHYTEFKFPKINANPWDRVLGSRTPSEVIDLISRLLDYTPIKRLEPLKACTHPFFDELRNPNTKLPNDRELPPLFNFTPQELKVSPKINRRLIPEHLHGQYSQYLQHSQKSADSSSGEGGDPAHDLDHASPGPGTSSAGASPAPGAASSSNAAASGQAKPERASSSQESKPHANSSSSNNNNNSNSAQVGSTTGGGPGSGNGSSGTVAHLATDPENSSVSTTSMHSVDAPSTESASSIEPVATTN